MNSDDERWNVVLPKPRPRGSHKLEDWVRNPDDYPDFPHRSARKWAAWDRDLGRYVYAWYDFLSGLTDSPPPPTQAVSSGHTKIAQREYRKRNGIPEPSPVKRNEDDAHE